MAHTYSNVSRNSSEFSVENLKPFERQTCFSRLSKKWLILILFVATNTLSISWPYWHTTESSLPSDLARVKPMATTWKEIWWNTPYSSSNHTEAAALWDAILPSHGFVAINREWAAENSWPESMYLPSDHSKGVYLLEAYHHLHCLKILRKTFWEAVDNRPYTYNPSAHMEHCWDSLRQYVQCNADNTPLYTFGDKTAGDGQVHQCRDWNQLREYATKNTACYRDSIEDIALGDHFGFCDDGEDGLNEL